MRNRSLVSEREFTRLVDRSIGRSLGRKLLTWRREKRRRMVWQMWNIYSEAMSDEVVTAMSTACGASIFVFELFKKKNLESICCPSYEMNAGSLQA